MSSTADENKENIDSDKTDGKPDKTPKKTRMSKRGECWSTFTLCTRGIDYFSMSSKMPI